MKDLVLDLVTSCENRMSMVEELVSGAYHTTATLDESLAEVTEKRAGLKTSLREILVRNCSLRRKDFNILMEKIISESERKKQELEEERTRVKQELEGYLAKQKELVTSLRQQLVDFTYEEAGKEALEATIARIRTAYQDKGQQVFSLLRDFQLRLDSFRVEQEEINHKLQGLVERGESLSLEDLRQLEAVKAGEERRVERQLRRQEVEKLLARFKEQRQGDNHWRR